MFSPGLSSRDPLPPPCPALLFIPSSPMWIWFLLLLLSYLPTAPISTMSYERVSSKLYVNDTRLSVILRSICRSPSNLVSLSLRDRSTLTHTAHVHRFYFAFVVVEVWVWVFGDEVVGTECTRIPEHTPSVPACFPRAGRFTAVLNVSPPSVFLFV